MGTITEVHLQRKILVGTSLVRIVFGGVILLFLRNTMILILDIIQTITMNLCNCVVGFE